MTTFEREPVSRRLFLMAAAGVATWSPLRATSAEFWNKKPPADWTREEIDRLITKSPWAKEVKAQYASGWPPSDGGGPTGPGPGTGTSTGGQYPGGQYPGGGYPGGGYPGGGYPGGGYPGGTTGRTGGGYPGGSGRTGGGIGIPGIGGIGIPGTGRGNGSPKRGSTSPYEGTVRWESARPILDAMKAPLAEAFEGRYVISVSGIPLMGGHSMATGEDDDSSISRREQEDLDRLKGLSSLLVKGHEAIQAGVVARQIGTGHSYLFGFSRELQAIQVHDAEILFTTQLGNLLVKAHFVPKEMLYHGELAV